VHPCRRAIDTHEGDKINEAALKDLIRAAVALNLKGKSNSRKSIAVLASVKKR